MERQDTVGQAQQTSTGHAIQYSTSNTCTLMFVFSKGLGPNQTQCWNTRIFNRLASGCASTSCDTCCLASIRKQHVDVHTATVAASYCAVNNNAANTPNTNPGRHQHASIAWQAVVHLPVARDVDAGKGPLIPAIQRISRHAECSDVAKCVPHAGHACPARKT